MNKCTIDGCDKPHLANGYCSKHYYRLKRNGDATKRTKSRDFWNIRDFMCDITPDQVNTYHFKNLIMWAIAAKLYYGDKCSVCGWNKVTCDVNHIIPKSQGGQNTIANAEVLCPNCHAEHHRNLPLEQREYITH